MKKYIFSFNIKAARNNIKWGRGEEWKFGEENQNLNNGVGEEYQVVGNYIHYWMFVQNVIYYYYSWDELWQFWALETSGEYALFVWLRNKHISWPLQWLLKEFFQAKISSFFFFFPSFSPSIYNSSSFFNDIFLYIFFKVFIKSY